MHAMPDAKEELERRFKCPWAESLQRCQSGSDGHLRMMEVSPHEIAGIWVAFFQECQQYDCCGQDMLVCKMSQVRHDHCWHLGCILAKVPAI